MPVVGFDVDFKRTLADGKSWGDSGPYEELRGKLRFAVDPLNEFNSRVTDVGLAPRNAVSAGQRSPHDRSQLFCDAP